MSPVESQALDAIEEQLATGWTDHGDVIPDHRRADHLEATFYADVGERRIRVTVEDKRKIDLADYVLVLNVGGYVGDSTRSEIEYARQIGKPTEWLEADA